MKENPIKEKYLFWVKLIDDEDCEVYEKVTFLQGGWIECRGKTETTKRIGDVEIIASESDSPENAIFYPPHRIQYVYHVLMKPEMKVDGD